MKIVKYQTERGIKYTSYEDDGPSFGFSGRAAYAMGYDKPNYPVPAPIHPVAWDMFDWLWIHGYISTEMWNTISLWELTRS